MAVRKTELADQKARDRIFHSLEESLLVEAAAGTGKTTCLVGRIVGLLGSGVTTVDRLVAVTFTRKAAGELKFRLRENLDQGRMAATEQATKDRLQTAVSELELARIGTIHSFCAELLRERPVEARIDPAFEELDEDEQARLFNRTFRPWIEEKLADLPPGLSRALCRSMLRQSFQDSPLDQIRDAGAQLLQWRDFPQQWRREKWDRQLEVDRIVLGLQQLSEMSWSCSNWSDDLRKSLWSVRELASWIRRTEAESPRDYDRLEAQLIDQLRELKRNQRKGRGPFSEKFSREQVLQARESLLDQLEEFRRRAEADLAALLQQELRGLVARYEAKKLSNGKLDFVDLLIRTRNLIRDNASVRQHFQKQFTHLFVDEFQDTDPLQAEILLLLAADDPSISDWEKVVPARGKFFAVGDPKQSIYRFRRADVLLYAQIKRQLQQEGVGLVKLTCSFRSVRPIQDFVNAAFAVEMSEDPVSGQPEYVAMDEYRPAIPEQPALVVLPAPHPYGQRSVTKSAIDQCLPETFAAFIQWLLYESNWKIKDPERGPDLVPIQPRHVCLLFRRFVSWKNDITRAYTRALESRRIPHVLVGSRSFHDREEVETLRTALSAIEWPDDELSIYATLRSSFFSIPDSLLLRFRSEVGRLHPFRPLPDDLPEAFEPVAEGLRILARLHRHRNRRPIVESIHSLMRHTRAHAGFALRPAGQQVLANLQRVCDLARAFEQSTASSFRSFVKRLLNEAGKLSQGDASVLEEGVDGVRLMTVHAAKGLEFPVVFLADPTCSRAPVRPNRFIDSKRKIAAFPLMGCCPWELLDFEDEELARDSAEATRLAYVAATRARDLLVLPGVGDGEEEGWLQPFNKAIYPPRDCWRKAEPAEGCPEFGGTSVLSRPVRFDGLPEISIRPGLHRPRTGRHEIVWWDPGLLNLNHQPDFGIYQEEILTPKWDEEKQPLGLASYTRWREGRRESLTRGRIPGFELVRVSKELNSPPPHAQAVDIEEIGSRQERPAGPRFGTLVHTLLRDTAPDSSPEELQAMARLQGRVLEATLDEMRAAAAAVSNALEHNLVKRAFGSEKLFRELPFLLREEHLLIEGTLDLAFWERDHWLVVDFKTDQPDETKRLQLYVCQVQWYVHAISKLTGQPGKGVLLLI